MEAERIATLRASLAELERARAKLERASDARRSLPPGSSRARVTTANARWGTAAEAAERARVAVVDAMSDLADSWGLPRGDGQTNSVDTQA